MNLSIGIVGLPNVGKSTLFNALLKRQQALVANYPFATIEPNIGVVGVPDSRLQRLAQIVSETDSRGLLPPIKPATVNFVDIAGLVKGASEGAGLGNKFLSHIREVSVIAHVVRAFEDSNIVREGSVGVREDYETINTELILADIQTLENAKVKIQNNFFDRLLNHLNNGQPVRTFEFSDEEKDFANSLFFLTNKPEIVVLNVSEEDYTEEKIKSVSERYTSILGISAQNAVVICAKIESELAGLTPEDQKEYLLDLGLKESGLERLIKKAYEELGLISFLTAPASAKASDGQGGKWEVRAWTVRRGSTALMASGEIHTDFMKKFIKAEVARFDDFIEFGGWKGAREHGKSLLEGRDYVIMDGDVVEFKIGT